MNEDKKIFPVLLEELRTARRMSKTHLAELAGMTPGYVSHLTRGERIAPSEETVRALADALALDTETRSALFEAAGYSPHLHFKLSGDVATGTYPSKHINQKEHTRFKEDLVEAPHIEHFYGREANLALLEQWILPDRSKIVAILGIGGVGKTTLAAQLVEKIKKDFTTVVWCSLRDAPIPTNILRNFLQLVFGPERGNVPNDEEQQIELLREYIKKERCLLVLDNLESILQSGDRVGQYVTDREGYAKIIEVFGEVPHQSCLLLTSREKPKDIARLEGTKVHAMQLVGVDQQEGQAILADKGLFGDNEMWAALIDRYAGNPLALKLVAAPISEIFAGDIAAFLRYSGSIIGDINDLLDEQFQRLSEQERELLYWLAIEREAVSLDMLQKDFVRPAFGMALLETLNSLQRRSIIDTTGAARFSLQPVIMEYVTNKFVESIFQEISTTSLKLFGSHVLMKAQAKDYIRASQAHLILDILAERLLAIYGRDGSEQKLKKILTLLHETHSQTSGYAAGNLLDLLIHLGYNLHNYDFSSLLIWQAYLQGADLSEVNFAHADFAQSVFTDAFGGVLAIVLSPNGELLAAGTTNSEIRIWRTADGLPLLSCEGHADWVRSLAFSADSTMLVSGSDDQTVRLWDVGTGQCLQVLAGHEGRVYSVAFSPDGTLLASGSEDQKVNLWRVTDEEGEQRPITLQGHTSRVRSVAFSPDGTLLATGSEDQIVRLWHIGKQGEQRQHNPLLLHGHTNRIWSVTFSPDGRLLASASEDQTVRLWSIDGSSEPKILTGHTKSARSVAFSPDGSLLASGSRDQTVRLWRVSTGESIKILRGHANLVVSVAFDSHVGLLASGSEDQTIRLWDIHTGQCLKILQGHSTLRYSVAFSPDGQLLANGNEDQTVRLWDVHTSQCIKILHGHANRIRSVAFSPDGRLLASGSDDQTIRLWDVHTNESVKTLHGHKDWVKSVAFSPDGRLLASGSDDQTVRVWDVRTGQCLKILRGHEDWVWSVAFSFDGQYIVSGGEDQVVRVWRVSTGELLNSLKGHTNAVWSVVFSPDGKTIASGSWDQTIRLWEATTGQLQKVLTGHADLVESVVFSPDGKTIASGSWDQTIRLWEATTGQLQKVLTGHTSWLYSVVFNTSGDTIASSSGDGTIRLWNVASGMSTNTLKTDRPYEHMNIADVTGLTETQKATLRALGAVEIYE